MTKSDLLMFHSFFANRVDEPVLTIWTLPGIVLFPRSAAFEKCSEIHS
jgi:hypothetical protein